MDVTDATSESARPLQRHAACRYFYISMDNAHKNELSVSFCNKEMKGAHARASTNCIYILFFSALYEFARQAGHVRFQRTALAGDERGPAPKKAVNNVSLIRIDIFKRKHMPQYGKT